jgi:hypothetical protein
MFKAAAHIEGRHTSDSGGGGGQAQRTGISFRESHPEQSQVHEVARHPRPKPTARLGVSEYADAACEFTQTDGAQH